VDERQSSLEVKGQGALSGGSGAERSSFREGARLRPRESVYKKKGVQEGSFLSHRKRKRNRYNGVILLRESERFEGGETAVQEECSPKKEGCGKHVGRVHSLMQKGGGEIGLL